jgi:hypothetical protein
MAMRQKIILDQRRVVAVRPDTFPRQSAQPFCGILAGLNGHYG